MVSLIVTHGHRCHTLPLCPSARTDHDFNSTIENLETMGVAATCDRLHTPLQGRKRPCDRPNAMGIAATYTRLCAPLREINDI
ncbi:MAG: hypothetical protein WBX01_13600 [Nitrososphaeraceae archaeon]